MPPNRPAAARACWRPIHAAIPRKALALARQAARLAGVELQLSDDLERDLPGAAVFVYITHSEGLGSGALLAMSAGVPVVASRVGGLPEIVRHRENGLLVENRAEAIAAAIRELLEDPPLARRLALAGRHTVERALHRGTHGPRRHGSLPAGALMIAPVLALLFGLLIGSFLNVCIYRWPRGPLGGAPALALPGVRKDHRVVRQHSAGELRAAGRPLPLLPRPHLAPLSGGGGA